MSGTCPACGAHTYDLRVFGDWVLWAMGNRPALTADAHRLVEIVDAYQCIGGLDTEEVYRLVQRYAAEDEEADQDEPIAVFRELEDAFLDGDAFTEYVPKSEALGGVPRGPGVYVLEDGDLIKVGVSKDVRTRFRDHRVSNLRLRMLAQIHGDETIEQKVHSMLAPSLLPQEREWFRRGPLLGQVLAWARNCKRLLWTWDGHIR